MMVDSGATITEISTDTATRAGIDAGANLFLVVLQTANGPAAAQIGTISELHLGNITATDLKVVITSGLGNMNVLGMNFLSRLQSWLNRSRYRCLG